MEPGSTVGVAPHTISVVVPVYQGQATLSALVAEIEPYFKPSLTNDGHLFVVSEVLLVYDNGPDDSAAVMRALAERFEPVRCIWLSRNFGQHAATLAGMASSGSDWIVTMDEDGQHDPVYIGRFLDVAMRERVGLVYAEPTNQPPHGFARNTASALTKWTFTRMLRGGDIGSFHSFRLVLGEVGRSVAAYSGAGVFLDVAMGWVNLGVSRCPVELRAEGARPSGYSTRRLLSHFWRLVLSSGTRGLRLVSILGLTFAIGGVAFAAYVVIGRIIGSTNSPGWASVVVIVLLGCGAILFSLGIIAEYIGVSVNMAMGKPLYLIVGDPGDGPLGRRPAVPAATAPHGPVEPG
ncbi:MAG: glycosyltransferase [Actinobacteria bacterium]|nr:glycosyltransferase [Actinomycetota bacterium]